MPDPTAAEMLEGRALLTGIVAGSLEQARVNAFPSLRVNIPDDGQGNYLPMVEVALGAKRYIVTVSADHTISEAPEPHKP